MPGSSSYRGFSPKSVGGTYTPIWRIVGRVPPGSTTLGAIAESGPVTDGTWNTGWTVGTATSGKYSILVYGSYPTAASFTTTSALAAATKPGASDSYRTESTYTGTFEAGNWAVSLAVSSGTASAVGRGRARYRIWASTDPTGQSSVRELTSGVNSTGILSALT